MGNQPNNFIQCGQDQKDLKQETYTTREQAIRQNKGQPIFKPQNTSKTTSTNIITENSQPPSSPKQQPSIFKPPAQPTVKNTFTGIPEHENLTKVSKSPKSLYYIVNNGEYYEQKRGKCLDEIIQSRYNTTMHFPEYQIQGLLECLVYGLAYMTKKQVNHHDFYPTNIFYNDGVFKLLNPVLVKKSGYTLTHQRQRFSFLSPQLILQVLNDTPQHNIPSPILAKSDVFAIGMILLEFCTLTPSSECYDPQTYSIVDSTINDRIEKMRALYNPLFADCIDLMLQYEVEKRIGPVELAYAVHAKVREIGAEGDGDGDKDRSRIQQASRMTMSGKVPQIGGQVMQGAQGIPPERVLGGGERIVGPPPGFMGQDPMYISQGPQPYLVSSNPKIIPPPPPPSTIPSFPYYNPNTMPTPSFPNLRNPQAPFHPSPSLSSQAQDPSSISISNLSERIMNPSSISTLPPEYNLPSSYKKSDTYLVTSEYKAPEPKYYTFTEKLAGGSQLGKAGSPLQNDTVKNMGIQNSNTKIKLNPFEEIQEDLKEDEDQSPEKYKIVVNPIPNPPQKPTEFSTNKPTTSYTTTTPTSYTNTNTTTNTSSPKQYKFKSSEYANMYNLKNTTIPNSSAYIGAPTPTTTSGTTTTTNTTTNITTNATTTSYNYQNKEESLDQRVRRILQASKHIT